MLRTIINKIPSKTRFLFILIIGTFFAYIFLQNGKLNTVKGTSCGTNCSLKEIGTVDGLGNFSKTTSLTLGQPYWVRLTINGEDNLPSAAPSSTPLPGVGVDTMMMIDLSSSMNKAYPKNDPDDGTTVIAYQAAQAALNKYIDISDQKNDYLGFGSFLWCGNYFSTATPVWWSYDDYNRGNGKMISFSSIHIPLKPINNNPNAYKSVINSIAYNAKDDPDYCGGTGLSNLSDGGNGGPYNTTGLFNGGTSIGGPITAAETFLTPILNDPKAKRSDGTSYRDAVKSKSLPTYNKNMGPYARQYTLGQSIPKYIILASDGAEGVPPLVTDQDIDKNLRTIVQNAKFHGVKIFMAVTKKQSGVAANNLARINYITSTTGGKAYYGGSQQELVNNFTSIRSDIVVDAGGGAPTPSAIAKTDIIVAETVTAGYFKIDEPNHSTPTFKVVQPGTPETDITNLMCKDADLNTIPDCVKNRRYDPSGNLIGYDVSLDPLGYGQSRYIYFRVTPIKSTLGLTVNVDANTTAAINYEDIPRKADLANVPVTISDVSPFFQVFSGGDVYSASGDVLNSIKSVLPTLTDVFTSSTNSVVIHKGGGTFGNGKVNVNNREVKAYGLTYDSKQMSYQNLYNEYGGLIPAANVKNISGVSDFTASGYYMDSNSSSSGKYVLSGAGWAGKIISGKTIVMFVPGDLYINENFSVQKDGKSLIIFIVKGRIGIDPSVTNVQGMFITDGEIDTACDSFSSFNSSNKCPPDAGASSTNAQLTLEGSFLSNSIDPFTQLYDPSIGGFSLDRTPVTSIPGEKFIYRPDFLMSSSLSIGRKSYTWIENVQ
jgi:hypothetical protein